MKSASFTRYAAKSERGGVAAAAPPFRQAGVMYRHRYGTDDESTGESADPSSTQGVRAGPAYVRAGTAALREERRRWAGAVIAEEADSMAAISRSRMQRCSLNLRVCQ